MFEFRNSVFMRMMFGVSVLEDELEVRQVANSVFVANFGKKDFSFLVRCSV